MTLGKVFVVYGKSYNTSIQLFFAVNQVPIGTLWPGNPTKVLNFILKLTRIVDYFSFFGENKSYMMTPH